MTDEREQPLDISEQATEVELQPGFHVMHEGVSLGCYPTAEDAEAFANGHPRANGLTVTVEEVKG